MFGSLFNRVHIGEFNARIGVEKGRGSNADGARNGSLNDGGSSSRAGAANGHTGAGSWAVGTTRPVSGVPSNARSGIRTLPDRYVAAPPDNLVSTGWKGIWVDDDGHHYLQSNGNWYGASYDLTHGTWRLKARDEPAKPGVPVRQSPDGSWWLNREVGLQGGGRSVGQVQQDVDRTNADLSRAKADFRRARRTLENADYAARESGRELRNQQSQLEQAERRLGQARDDLTAACRAVEADKTLSGVEMAGRTLSFYYAKRDAQREVERCKAAVSTSQWKESEARAELQRASEQVRGCGEVESRLKSDQSRYEQELRDAQSEQSKSGGASGW